MPELNAVLSDWPQDVSPHIERLRTEVGEWLDR